MANGESCQLCSVGHEEFVEDVAQVGADGARCHEELLSDGPVPESEGGEPDHAGLGRGEAFPPADWAGASPPRAGGVGDCLAEGEPRPFGVCQYKVVGGQSLGDRALVSET